MHIDKKGDIKLEVANYIEPTFTIKVVAKHLQCSERLIREHIDKGILKAFKLGNHIRINQSALEDYMSVTAGYKSKEVVELENRAKELEEENKKLRDLIYSFFIKFNNDFGNLKREEY